MLLLLFLVCIVAVSGCFSSERLEYLKAEKSAQKSEFEIALKHYRTLVDRYVRTPLAIKSAKEAARISHYELARYPEAIELYKHVILYAANENDRIAAQQKIADIYFNQTMNYEQAIIEYSRLLELKHTPHEELNYRLTIARSYFYTSNFFQAQVEINQILKLKPPPEILFDALVLRANIFLTNKTYDDAVAVLRQLIKDYPKRAQTENLALTLAVAYEDQKNYLKAIETLESIRDTYPRRAFIEARIKSLKERQSYLPGARGWKK